MSNIPTNGIGGSNPEENTAQQKTVSFSRAVPVDLTIPAPSEQKTLTIRFHYPNTEPKSELPDTISPESDRAVLVMVNKWLPGNTLATVDMDRAVNKSKPCKMSMDFDWDISASSSDNEIIRLGSRISGICGIMVSDITISYTQEPELREPASPIRERRSLSLTDYVRQSLNNTLEKTLSCDTCTFRPKAVTPHFLEIVKSEVGALNEQFRDFNLTYNVVRFHGESPESTNALIVFRWNRFPESSKQMALLQSRLIKEI